MWWYLLAGTRGGENRARISRARREQPRNANQLADQLGLDYNAVTYQLDMLTDHDVLETCGDEFERVSLPSDRFERYDEAFDRITDRLE